MKIILLAAAGAVALTAAPALAAPKGATVAGPSQPIPYDQLSAYLKASPKQRAAKDWWSGQSKVAATAETGAAANTSATVPATPSLPGDTPSPSADAPAPGPSLPANPPIDTAPPSTTVNPPASAAPGSPPASTPPK